VRILKQWPEEAKNLEGYGAAIAGNAGAAARPDAPGSGRYRSAAPGTPHLCRLRPALFLCQCGGEFAGEHAEYRPEYQGKYEQYQRVGKGT
jgi:hypothetical protein